MACESCAYNDQWKSSRQQIAELKAQVAAAHEVLYGILQFTGMTQTILGDERVTDPLKAGEVVRSLIKSQENFEKNLKAQVAELTLERDQAEAQVAELQRGEIQFMDYKWQDGVGTLKEAKAKEQV